MALGRWADAGTDIEMCPWPAEDYEGYIKRASTQASLVDIEWYLLFQALLGCRGGSWTSFGLSLRSVPWDQKDLGTVWVYQFILGLHFSEHYGQIFFLWELHRKRFCSQSPILTRNQILKDIAWASFLGSCWHPHHRAWTIWEVYFAGTDGEICLKMD